MGLMQKCFYKKAELLFIGSLAFVLEKGGDWNLISVPETAIFKYVMK
jgi:hypothetical protein